MVEAIKNGARFHTVVFIPNSVLDGLNVTEWHELPKLAQPTAGGYEYVYPDNSQPKPPQGSTLSKINDGEEVGTVTGYSIRHNDNDPSFILNGLPVSLHNPKTGERVEVAIEDLI